MTFIFSTFVLLHVKCDVKYWFLVILYSWATIYLQYSDLFASFCYWMPNLESLLLENVLNDDFRIEQEMNNNLTGSMESVSGSFSFLFIPIFAISWLALSMFMSSCWLTDGSILKKRH